MRQYVWSQTRQEWLRGLSVVLPPARASYLSVTPRRLESVHMQPKHNQREGACAGSRASEKGGVLILSVTADAWQALTQHWKYAHVVCLSICSSICEQARTSIFEICSCLLISTFTLAVRTLPNAPGYSVRNSGGCVKLFYVAPRRHEQ